MPLPIREMVGDTQVAEWLKGFAARVDCLQRLGPPEVTEGGFDQVAISNQYAKVLACIDSALKTNGKTVHKDWYNLRSQYYKHLSVDEKGMLVGLGSVNTV